MTRKIDLFKLVPVSLVSSCCYFLSHFKDAIANVSIWSQVNNRSFAMDFMD